MRRMKSFSVLLLLTAALFGAAAWHRPILQFHPLTLAIQRPGWRSVSLVTNPLRLRVVDAHGPYAARVWEWPHRSDDFE